MKSYMCLSACVALAIAGLVAGCGGGGSTSTPATTPTATVTDSTATSTTTSASSGATPDDVFNACTDALSNVGSEQFVQQSCSRVRDAFEQCNNAASNTPEGAARDAAVKACQQAADQTVSGLESSG